MKSAWSSVLLVTLACASLLALMWWLPPTSLFAWQAAHLHWNYAIQIFFFLIPLPILALGVRTRAEYGLIAPGEPGLHARLAVMLVIVLVLVPLAAQAAFGRLALNRTFAAFPISTIVFHFVFSSFGEELFFRGFMQGELNRAFGRPWRFAGVPFGIGLVVSTLTFAVAHGVEQFDPLRGRYQFDAQAFLATGTFAIFVGLLRERTGSILAPAMLHATIDLNWHLLRLDRVLRIAQVVCTGVAFFFILRWFTGDDRHSPAARAVKSAPAASSS